ncbi:DUF1428 domain-containing protein [Novosphingobium olei]|uniref:DUF1428 domain-containing protein n=1 Tax=Novosphingobium olei TaxID=2728851 RepID=A0A7Y0G9I8_9SPHN|nr:DUF1428 domain-containing protein [Novosphingobium olei]NML93098.1 DUF1428 domain-containing protein [Novosphingobium olei]BEU99657.1 DUF1428 domain-containing protein [Novosphingobium olei]
MTWIDGYVIPVLEARRADYARMARTAAHVFIKHGALHVLESWSADLPAGEVTDFRRAVAAEEGEGVVFSMIVWPDRATRDAGHKAVFEDPRMAEAIDMSVFNSKRMIIGGFEEILSMRASGGEGA